MRRNVVLIDLESVQPETLAPLLEEHFEVLLFVGANQTRVNVELAAAMQKLGARGKYIRMMGNGPNALDFHIAYYIGRFAVEDPQAFFHIISRDKGFDPLIAHLKTNKILAGRWESVGEIPIVKNANLKSPRERAEAYVARLRAPKASRPRTEQALSKALNKHFHNALDDHEVRSVIQAIQASGFLSVSNDGKVIYAATDS